MIAALKKLALAWAASWMFLLWSALCVLVGVSLGLSAAVTALEANGIHVTSQLTRMAGLQ